MISLDCETSGLDLRHGARPFFVTITNMQGEISYWEWRVDPIHRIIVPRVDGVWIDKIQTVRGYDTREELLEIKEIIDKEDYIVGQNIKFDCGMLTYLFKDYNIPFEWPWHKTHDTLIASHILDSGSRHNLTELGKTYLGKDISKLEEALKKACMSARNIAKRRYPMWLIAKEGLDIMPSAKGGNKRESKGLEGNSPWKFDMFLPKELAIVTGEKLDHPWHIVLSKYSNKDSEITLRLWIEMERLLKERGYWKIYLDKMKLPKILFEMEDYGTTLIEDNLTTVLNDCTRERDRDTQLCCNIASTYKEPDGTPFDFVMPNGASPNDSMRQLVFNHMGVRGIVPPKAKTNNPSLDAASLDSYLLDLPKASKPHVFITALRHKRKRDTAITYLRGYRKFGLKLGNRFLRLYPSFNQTGTRTLRKSSNNPNFQNISKKESQCRVCEGDGCVSCNQTGIDFRSLRYAFGPAPGRVWVSIDYQNLELRIPSYVANEEEFIKLFERPKDPPYYGSNHLLIAHLLFPKEFNTCINKEGILDGRLFKDHITFKEIYQRVKNGNFAVQYGSIDKADGTGTADRTYGLKGAQSMISKRFSKMEALNQDCIKMARRLGYVETMPSRRVDPKRGYPLMVEKSWGGKIVETQPLNYFVQGTACDIICSAEIKVSEQLRVWRQGGWDGHMIADVHDELIIDAPKPNRHPNDEKNGKFRISTDIGWRIKILQGLMQSCGADLLHPNCPNGIPTPTSAKYHEHNWSEGDNI